MLGHLLSSVQTPLSRVRVGLNPAAVKESIHSHPPSIRTPITYRKCKTTREEVGGRDVARSNQSTMQTRWKSRQIHAKALRLARHGPP